MKRLLIVFVLFSALAAKGQVSITTHYDNRDAAVCWMSDDYSKSHGYQAFLNYADLCRENGMVLGVGVICSLSTNILVSSLQQRIDAGCVEVCNHSWNMDDPNVFPTNQIEPDMILSTAFLTSNYVFQSHLRYNGSNFLTAWIQPYGQPTTNLVYLDVLRPILSDMGYLSDRGTLTGQNDFSAWDEAEGLFERWTSASGSTNLGYQLGILTNAMVNKGVFAYYNHCYQPAITNDLARKSGFHYDFVVQSGNRKNCWYCGPNSLYSYRYIATRANVSVDYEDASKDLRFTCSIGQSDREKYGLSVPVTYRYALPTAWANAAGISAEVTLDDAEWNALPEKTTNDFFNTENCYRWDKTSNCVYVSYGFPQTGTNFSIRLTPKSRGIPSGVLSIKTGE